MARVLVTGGTGFIAGHCIKQLLQQGYEVVTTVRSPEKGAKLVNAFTGSQNGDKGNGKNLSYQIVQDIAQKGAFDEVFRSTSDLTYVVHTASPFHYNVQDPVKDFLEPAVDGVKNVLEAIKQHAPSVKRVVLTSSFAAVRGGSDANPPFFDESCWNPVTWDEAATNTKLTYQGSKTLAERAAWSFMSESKPSFDLVAINPSLVFGPAAPHLTTPSDISSLNTSNVRILDMLQGRMKDRLAPTGFYTWVDVRDVALAHVRALTIPEASGQRFLLMTGYFSNRELAKIVGEFKGGEFRDRLPENLEGQEDNVPPVQERYGFSNERSRKVLGVEYLDLETSVRDTVESLVRMGAAAAGAADQ